MPVNADMVNIRGCFNADSCEPTCKCTAAVAEFEPFGREHGFFNGLICKGNKACDICRDLCACGGGDAFCKLNAADGQDGSCFRSGNIAENKHVLRVVLTYAKP